MVQSICNSSNITFSRFWYNILLQAKFLQRIKVFECHQIFSSVLLTNGLILLVIFQVYAPGRSIRASPIPSQNPAQRYLDVELLLQYTCQTLRYIEVWYSVAPEWCNTVHRAKDGAGILFYLLFIFFR